MMNNRFLASICAALIAFGGHFKPHYMANAPAPRYRGGRNQRQRRRDNRRTGIYPKRK